MAGKFSRFFRDLATGRMVLISLIIYAVFAAWVMPSGAEKIRQASDGRDLKILDLQFDYSPAQAREYLALYSAESRNILKNFILTADTVYPLTYTFFFMMLMAWLYKGIPRKLRFTMHIHLLPLVILLLDYCENVGMTRILNRYPDFSDELVQITSLCTTSKWVMVIVCAVLILGGFALRYFPKKQTAS